MLLSVILVSEILTEVRALRAVRHTGQGRSVLEGEVPCVEAGPRQGPEHLRPICGSGGQQGLHAGGDVLQVGAAHLKEGHGGSRAHLD